VEQLETNFKLLEVYPVIAKKSRVTQKPVLLLLHRVTEELSPKKPGQTKPPHRCKKAQD